MPRLVSRPVTVKAQRGRPFAFSFQGSHRVARLLEEWREAGEWWRGDGEKRVFRVVDEAGGMFELLFDMKDSRWSLEKVYD